MKILITGGKGMLGKTLQRRLANHDLVIADLPEVDITRLEAIANAIAESKPDVVIHCAAMTAVDACETEVKKAFAVNAIGSRNVAISCHRNDARLIAISTDYVFPGDSDRPYHEWDAIGPKSVYGQSKLAGEQEIQRHCPDHVILRVAWLYGENGPSFVHTMLKLGSQEGPALKIVEDQIGDPTSTDAVANTVDALIQTPAVGIFHCTCEGETTWYEFTKEIFRLKGLTREIIPCTSDEYSRPAPRPANSRLDNMSLRILGLPEMLHWQDALLGFLETNN